MKRVLIKDIAKKAGVSNATVSLVLNGKEKDGRVSKEVAERIRNMAREMDYQPNALARSLKSGRTHTIGLIVADITNPFFSQLAYYIQEQMEQYDYTVVIMNTNENDQVLERNIGMLSIRQVDGYIIVPTENGESIIRKLVEEKLPLVLIDRCFPMLSTYTVMLDSYQAAFQATSGLIKAGCTKIGLITYKSKQSHMNERMHGFTDSLQQAGLFHEEYIRQVSFKSLSEDIKISVSSLVDTGIDGILFSTNTISLTGVRALSALGIRIPEQVRVVAFDESEAFEFMPDPLPYIRQPIETMGRKAADLLYKQMNESEHVPQVCKYPGVLIEKKK